MTPERRGLLGAGVLLACLVLFAEISNWRAGRYADALPPRASHQSDSWAPLDWKVRIADLPQQASLYEAVTREFAKAWQFVCVGTVIGGGPLTKEQTVDPPDEVVRLLKSRVPAFRPISSCTSYGEDVIDSATGKGGGATLILRSAESHATSTRVAVTWCCWAGWGVFRADITPSGWLLKGTEQWFQS